MSKQLIVLCDGTTKSPESDQGRETNIQILRKLLGIGWSGRRKVRANPEQGWEIDKYRLGDIKKYVYYDRGLGAPKLDSDGKLLEWNWSPLSMFKNAQFIYSKFQEMNEQITAHGIIDNVAQAYNFLMRHYEPGDKIFLFGFSRGAYTLRILETVIRYIGLIDKSKYESNEDLEDALEYGFSLYDMKLHPNSNPVVLEFRENCHPHTEIIHFLGLWDTVRGLVKEKVFSDAKLSSAVKISRHALAIDEQRENFKPEVWIAKPDADSQQVWFSGVHSDVGGGYPEHGLSNISLYWMVTEAIKYGLDIDLEIFQTEFVPDQLAMQNDSLRAKIQEDLDICWDTIGGLYRRPIGLMTATERLHETVLARYGNLVKREKADIFYHPSNLTHTLVAYQNSIKNYDTPLTEVIATLQIPEPDTLSDVGEDTSLIPTRKI